MAPRKFFMFLLLVYLCTSVVIGEDKKYLDNFQGAIIDSSGAVPRISMTQFWMKIEKYTSDEDVMKYASILTEKGPDALADAIHKLENGRIKIGNRLSYHLSITRSFEKDGKRIVRALTDRPIAMVEAMKNPRSRDYQFGVVEIVLESDGKGQGNLIAAAKIEFKDKNLEIESFGLEPFRITNVTAK
jgi:hypothetical protein